MSTFLLLICVLQFLHFVWYIVSVRIKRGFIIDFWAFLMITANIVYYFLMYPFAKSIENEVATGDAQFSIASHVDQALLITATGYACMWIGKYWFDRTHKNRWISEIRLWKPATLIKNIINSKNALWILFILFLPCFLFVAKEALSGSNVLDARSSIGESSSERPFYNIATSVYPIFIAIVGVLYLDSYKIKYLIGFLVLLGFSFIFGTRGAAFSALATTLFIFIVSKGRNIGWTKLSLIGGGLILGIVGFGLLRGGATELSGSDVFASFLYGNTFSDLRDFAWFLSAWNGELIMGKTYLAGILSFIPSGMWEFRSIWSIGKVTTTTTGLTGMFHGGLRITFFGESYINFGIIGTAIFSFTFGYLLEDVNIKVMRLIQKKEIINAYSMMLMTSILTSFMITASFFSIYIIFVPMLFLYIISTKKKRSLTHSIGSS